jgi:aldehyde:ferredoxin oxidoreductase
VLHGYTGKILHVNLTDGALEVEQPSEDFYRTYMGGSALGLYYLLKHTPAGADPFGPENTLVFAISGPTGAPISGQSRCTVVAKSPLTDGVGDGQAGGFWPAELKFAGFDAIVVRGASPKPVYLWVHDGEAELRDASHLWGQATREAEAMLVEELGDERIEVAQIGPAGEKLVRYATIMNMSNRAHGRTGMGAVMGSKKLKAIAVRGTQKKISIADEETLKALTKHGVKAIPENASVEALGKYGTARVAGVHGYTDQLITRNWQSGHFGEDRTRAITGETMYDTILHGAAEGKQDRLGRDTCYACAVRCKRVVEAEWNGRSIDPESGGPEYEMLATFGSYCDIDDPLALAYTNQLCNQYGVDTISAGATIAFAIECFDNEVISVEDTGGLALRWGDAEAMIAMLEMIVEREGFGDVLAEGSARAAEKIGNGAGRYVMAVKKQEIPAHMPHTKRSLGLIYAVNPFGPDHKSNEQDPSYTPQAFEKFGNKLGEIGLASPQDAKVLNKEKVEFALITQYTYSALDTLSVCMFVYGPGWELYGVGELAQMVSAVTGWDVTVDELQAVGARRLNLLRAFNAREGITREGDTLPKRFFDEPLKGGRTEGLVVDRAEWEAALDEYYAQAGWDTASGNPTRETLEGLGLAWVADEIGV